MTPIAAFLTTIYHVVLFVLSYKRMGPPPIPITTTILDQNNTNGSRTSVYRPGSPINSGRLGIRSNLPQTVEEQRYHGQTIEPYPPFLINVANCTISCLLAVFWTSFPWIPAFVGFIGWEGWSESKSFLPLSIAEATLGYLETLVMWAIFGLCVHHRKQHLKRNEFIRMDG
ncbi:SubName: Full=Uncharacterized protein {ECO:0000313/EMBL:CCA75361.1} [Serendipita indica DSM 11827]|uniref:Uncharacterized protein n=1 Tax=Serendipita indica (strain DSM 11827) TaxID=1109443 RepID=G4TVL8_SERID|nr:SubName: Full=Uncharacterized protein {ECO:0000313/EMBL:CCA75361.1} [Serendipita indica DSM 11827]CCA75361.1 hypothetical protein PIIN_09345 [Serendipita indica DSM 11827]